MQERSYSVLIVSSSEKFNTYFTDILSGPAICRISRAISVSEARRSISERDFDMIIINSPVRDDTGVRFALDASDRPCSVVMFAAEQEMYADCFNRMSSHGIFMLMKPSTRSLIQSAVSWLITARERIRMTEVRESSVEEKMNEIRLVNRAKWILINDQGLTEPEAHMMINRMAMDRCVSKKEIAEEIISKGG